ncbi:hypothetical protein SAMN05444159_6890 [Bradyrhizobium lablabi]|uniref:Uncharacterized protein n=1 Tax=Bradyrhizobium lablabi TaxID=722472 RepID=A0A1M7DQW0_9BRAD|nr:hypothetical protein SAMN05444159_6890 [Bradyrhizobium lablabi]
MHNNPRCFRNDAAKRCAICSRRFGLIRYYSCQTALCSKKCIDRFSCRLEADRRWFRKLQAA